MLQAHQRQFQVPIGAQTDTRAGDLKWNNRIGRGATVMDELIKLDCLIKNCIFELTACTSISILILYFMLFWPSAVRNRVDRANGLFCFGGTVVVRWNIDRYLFVCNGSLVVVVVRLLAWFKIKKQRGRLRHKRYARGCFVIIFF